MSSAAIRRVGWLQHLAVGAGFVLLAALYTRPLLAERTTRIAGDAGDPLLVATALVWNATTVPLTARWWNIPLFYPAHGVTTFTENFLGIAPVSTPIYWLTRDPLATYNLTLFLTWPLSAFAAYLLVWRLTARADAAIVAGVAYGFAPYRLSELGHLQMLASWWMPLALLGLHGYLTSRRRRWLVLFGAAWLLKALANMYMLLFGGVLIGLWLLFFCWRWREWRVAAEAIAAWALFSLPLVPVLIKYQEVHAFYGLRRNLDDPFAFSAPAGIWLNVSHLVRTWGSILHESGDNHFPGVTLVVLVLAGIIASRVARRRTRAEGRRPRWRVAASLLLVACLAIVASSAWLGPWEIALGGVRLLRVGDPSRAVFAATALAGVLLLTMRDDDGARRAFAFYAAAALALLVLSAGPVFRLTTSTYVFPAPYSWLMTLPGFDELRVPMRFWMPGVMCASIAAGLAIALWPARRTSSRVLLSTVAVAGLLADSWISAMPMASVVEPWPAVEPAASATGSIPILELPIGPDWDAAATYHLVFHRRPVVNAVSGYDPPHYDPLMEGLNGHDPAMLAALASFGAYDIVPTDDSDGRWRRYVLTAPGAAAVHTDGVRTAYRVPAMPRHEPAPGRPLPIASVTTSAGDDGRAMIDGRPDTEWRIIPQKPGQWVIADLGTVASIGGVAQTLGAAARDFPRVLAIDVSLDGAAWTEVWQGRTAAFAFLAAVDNPTMPTMRFAFAPVRGRFVRLRQLAAHRNFWRIGELTVQSE
jgi:hypothetical protein